MHKISCIIIDDEPLALNLTESYVNKTAFLELKGKYHSAIEAIEIINSEKINLLFLDIQMPDLNGIELSHTLQKGAKVIFTTAFTEFAIEGFKADALDYLLKPFNYEEFLKAANKAKEWFDLIEASQNQVQNENRNYIFVKSEYKQIKINLDDVFYFEGLKDYIKIWLKSQPKPILTLMSLKSLEEELPATKFMRIHRSFIIALDKIQAVERMQVIINNVRISVAEHYKEKFQVFISGKSV